MSRRGRWLLATVALALLLALAALTLVGRVMEPERLTPILLRQASAVLGLELRLREPAEYALRPEPRLLLRGLEAFEAGQPDPLAAFERIELSLPWSTLRGQALAINRIDIEGAVVDVPRTQAWLVDWLDARPAGEEPADLPTLTRGLRISASELRSDAWRISGLELALDRFGPGLDSDLAASGTLHVRERTLPFDLSALASLDARPDDLALAIPALALDLRDGAGTGASHYALSLAAAEGIWDDAGWSASAQQLGLTAVTGNPEARMDLQLAAPGIAGADGGLHLAPAGFRLEGGALVPESSGVASLRFDSSQLAFVVDGRIQQWPPGWPALPEPLGSNPLPLDVAIRYAGSPGLDDPIEAAARRDGAAVSARFDLWPLLEWRLADTGSPLPPFQGQLQADELQFDGARLRGVRLRLGEPDGERP